MEDFFDGAFESSVSVSQNTDVYFDMDSILYGGYQPKPKNNRQQKAKSPRVHDKDKHKHEMEEKNKNKKSKNKQNSDEMSDNSQFET